MLLLLIDLSTVKEPHGAEVSDHVAPSMINLSAPLETHAQEEGPVQLGSCPMVEAPLEVETVEIQEPIAAVVDNGTPLTHESDLGNFAIDRLI